MALYFIGILTSEEIQQQVLHWKNYMLQQFGCRNALKSPAHITLIPPFDMQEDLQRSLQQSLEQFSAGQSGFSVSIQNFSSFGMKVIFAEVEENPALDKLRRDLEEWLVRAHLFHLKRSERLFHPHITIANRDLKKKDFFDAWNHFSRQVYANHFLARGISLLLHDGKVWNPAYTAPFTS